MDDRRGQIERLRCRTAVLGMMGLTAAALLPSGCSSHYHYGYGSHGYGSYSYGHCGGGGDAGLWLLLVYGAAGILHWCFN